MTRDGSGCPGPARPDPGASPAVSVVIPTARGGAYLREAVASVLDQTMADFELIIVADGCEDDQLDELPALDGRIRVIRQENRGVSVARNAGIRASRADLVAFLDDDDRMRPTRLESQVSALIADPGATLCHSQFGFIDGEGRPTRDGYARDVGYPDLLRGELGVLMPTATMRRATLLEVGMFDAALTLAEDVDLIMRVARQGRLIFIPEILTEYRVHGANISQDTRAAGAALEAVLTRHLDRARRHGDRAAVEAAGAGIRRVRRLAGAGHLVHARQAWNRREFGPAVRSTLRATRHSPVVVARDLIGNRRVLAALRHKGGRHPQIKRRPA